MRKALLEGDANHGHVMYAVIGQVHEFALQGGILCAGQGQPRKVGAEYQGSVAGNVAELRSTLARRCRRRAHRGLYRQVAKTTIVADGAARERRNETPIVLQHVPDVLPDAAPEEQGAWRSMLVIVQLLEQSFQSVPLSSVSPSLLLP